MRQLFCAFVALVVTTSTWAGVDRWAKAEVPVAPVDPNASAAVFVGVRDFDDPTLTSVKYAVDDAIDLAYAVSMSRTPLVDPSRVILALSGIPQKPESARKLQKLLANGARQKLALSMEIVIALEEQSRAVEKDGLLIAGFATHGMNEDGLQHLLGKDSRQQYARMSITDVMVRDIVSRAPRALVFIDACRGRLTSETRSGDPHPRASALLTALGKINGMCGLSAARNGEYAYDDDARLNGVFTAAVIDGLDCGAHVNDEGYVTLGELAVYVEGRVVDWIRREQGRVVPAATQLHCDVASADMPLSACSTDKRQADPRD